MFFLKLMAVSSFKKNFWGFNRVYVLTLKQRIIFNLKHVLWPVRKSQKTMLRFGMTIFLLLGKEKIVPVQNWIKLKNYKFLSFSFQTSKKRKLVILLDPISFSDTLAFPWSQTDSQENTTFSHIFRLSSWMFLFAPRLNIQKPISSFEIQ